MLIWSGCTAERKYQWVSFFFDGVPDPNARSAQVDSTGNATPPRAAYVEHQPFADRDCKACHASFNIATIGRADRNACIRCHEQVTTQYPVMHGPVAIGACLICHHPHESPYPHLLREPDVQLCVTCHDRQSMLGPNPPAHLDAQRSCLECHLGHGGLARNLLRDSLLQEQSSTPPDQPTEDFSDVPPDPHNAR